MKLTYTPDKFQKLLAQFQSAVDSGEYKEKIPYDTWRKLKKLHDPRIEFTSPFVRIYDVVLDNYGAVHENIVFSAKVYDWGFGRFFYDTVVKEQEKMHYSPATAALAACDSAISAAAEKAFNDKVNKSWDDILGKAESNWKADVCTTADIAATKAVTNTTDSTSLTYIGDSLSTKTIPNYDWDNTATSIDGTSYLGGWGIVDRISELESQLDQKADKVELEILKNRKENGTMMKGFNFDFGPCGNTVRLSMYGMAIQNVAGEWVSYNPDSREIINVDVFNIQDGGKYMYKMPVAMTDVKVGDVVIHNRVPMFVTAVNENGSFDVTDVRAGETKTIIPTRNMFGFNFMTKVVSMFSAFTNAPTADQPFGNMLPFLMMSDKDGKAGDIDPMVMFMMMQGQNGTGNMFGNPMMLYFMMKDNKDIDPMMLMCMMNMNQPHTCKCEKPADKAPAVV